MSNSTIMAVPMDLSNPRALRSFLVNLVVELDIALGYRGGRVLATEQFTRDQIRLALQKAAKLEKLDLPTRTASATYNQAEMQQLMDDVKSIADKLDELLEAL